MFDTVIYIHAGKNIILQPATHCLYQGDDNEEGQDSERNRYQRNANPADSKSGKQAVYQRIQHVCRNTP